MTTETALVGPDPAATDTATGVPLPVPGTPALAAKAGPRALSLVAPVRSWSVTTWLATSMLVLVVLLITVVPFLPTFNVTGQDLANSLLSPFVDPAHPLGTDSLGRDLLSRLAVATQVSLGIALGAVAISAVIGLTLGLLSGYARGRLDQMIMGLGDIQLAIPVVLLLIVLVAALGSSPALLIVLLGVTNWVSFGRVSRSIAMSLREQEFVLAATSAGASGWWNIRKHLLPNVMPRVLILAAFDLGVVITIESSLSFIGLGVQPPTPSLGLMINEGQRYLQSNPPLTVLPAVVILLIIGGIQFLSQGAPNRKRA